MQVVAAKAVAFGEALRPEFRKYARQVLTNAKTLEKELTRRGWKVLFGGTENHMLVVDVATTFGIGGREAEQVLDKVGITVNKNMIPDDPRKPLDPSGLRIGVPAATTRGLKAAEMKKLARWIDEALRNREDAKFLRALRVEVRGLCMTFPVYNK